MVRLIDADALDMYEALKSYYGDAWRDAQKEIDNAPTVDAVPVCRCKDCEHWRANTQFCSVFSSLNIANRMPPNGYCSEAERKEE